MSINRLPTDEELLWARMSDASAARSSAEVQAGADRDEALRQSNRRELEDASGTFFGELTNTGVRRNLADEYDSLLRMTGDGTATDRDHTAYQNAYEDYMALVGDGASFTEAVEDPSKIGNFLAPLAANTLTDFVPQAAISMGGAGVTGSRLFGMGAAGLYGINENVTDVRTQFATDQGVMDYALQSPEAADEARARATQTGVLNAAADIVPGAIGARVAKGLGGAVRTGAAAPSSLLKDAAGGALGEVAQDSHTAIQASSLVGDDLTSRLSVENAIDSAAGGAIQSGAVGAAGNYAVNKLANGRNATADALADLKKPLQNLRKQASQAGADIADEGNDSTGALAYRAAKNLTDMSGKALRKKLGEVAPDLDSNGLRDALTRVAEAETLGGVIDDATFETLKGVAQRPAVMQTLGLAGGAGKASLNVSRLMMKAAAQKTQAALDADWGLHDVIGTLEDVANVDNLASIPDTARSRFTAAQRTADLESWDALNTGLAGKIDFGHVQTEEARQYLGGLYRKAKAVHTMSMLSDSPSDVQARALAEGVLNGDIDISRDRSAADRVQSFSRRYAASRAWADTTHNAANAVSRFRQALSDIGNSTPEFSANRNDRQMSLDLGPERGGSPTMRRAQAAADSAQREQMDDGQGSFDFNDGAPPPSGPDDYGTPTGKRSKRNVQSTDITDDDGVDELAVRLERLVPPHKRSVFGEVREALIKTIVDNPDGIPESADAALNNIFDNPKAKKAAKDVVRAMATADLRQSIGSKAVRNQLYDLMSPQAMITARREDMLRGGMQLLASRIGDLTGHRQNAIREAFEGMFPDPQKREQALDILEGVRQSIDALAETQSRWVSDETENAVYEEGSTDDKTDVEATYEAGNDAEVELEVGSPLDEFLSSAVGGDDDLIGVAPESFELAAFDRKDLSALHPAGTNTDIKRKTLETEGVVELSGREFFDKLEEGNTRINERVPVVDPTTGERVVDAEGNQVYENRLVSKNLTNRAGLLMNRALQDAKRVLDSKLRGMKRGSAVDTRSLAWLLRQTPSLSERLLADHNVTSDPKQDMAALDAVADTDAEYASLREMGTGTPTELYTSYLAAIRGVVNRQVQMEMSLDAMNIPADDRPAIEKQMRVESGLQDALLHEKNLRVEMAGLPSYGPQIMDAVAKTLAANTGDVGNATDMALVRDYHKRLLTYASMLAKMARGSDTWKDDITVTVRNKSDDWMKPLRDRSAASDEKLKTYQTNTDIGNSGYRVYVTFKDGADGAAPKKALLSSKSMIAGTRVANAVDDRKELLPHTRFYAALGDVMLRDDVARIEIEPDFGVQMYSDRLADPNLSPDVRKQAEAKLSRAQRAKAEWDEQNAATGGMIVVEAGSGMAIPQLPAQAILQPPSKSRPEPNMTGYGFDGRATGNYEPKQKAAPKQDMRGTTEPERPANHARYMDRIEADIRGLIDGNPEYEKIAEGGSAREMEAYMRAVESEVKISRFTKILRFENDQLLAGKGDPKSVAWLEYALHEAANTAKRQEDATLKALRKHGRYDQAVRSVEQKIGNMIDAAESRGDDERANRFAALVGMYASEEGNLETAQVYGDYNDRAMAFTRISAYRHMLNKEIEKQAFVDDQDMLLRADRFYAEFASDEEAQAAAYETHNQALEAINTLIGYGMPPDAAPVKNFQYIADQSLSRAEYTDARDGEYRAKVAAATGMNPDPSRVLAQNVNVRQQNTGRERNVSYPMDAMGDSFEAISRAADIADTAEANAEARRIEEYAGQMARATPAQRKQASDFMKRVEAAKGNPTEMAAIAKEIGDRRAAESEKAADDVWAATKDLDATKRAQAAEIASSNSRESKNSRSARIRQLRSEFESKTGDLSQNVSERLALGDPQLRETLGIPAKLGSVGEIEVLLNKYRKDAGIEVELDYSSVKNHHSSFAKSLAKNTDIGSIRATIAGKMSRLEALIKRNPNSEQVEVMRDEISMGQQRIAVLEAQGKAATPAGRKKLGILGAVDYLEGLVRTRQMFDPKVKEVLIVGADRPVPKDNPRVRDIATTTKSLYKKHNLPNATPSEVTEAVYRELRMLHPEMFAQPDQIAVQLEKTVQVATRNSQYAIDYARAAGEHNIDGDIGAKIKAVADGVRGAGAKTASKKNRQAAGKVADDLNAQLTKLAEAMIGKDTVELQLNMSAEEIGGASGETIFDDVGDTIVRVALDAVDRESVMRHELFHVLWSSLNMRNARVRELKGRISKLANRGMNRSAILEELVRIDEARGANREASRSKFIRELVDPEETAAYLYQLYTDGNLVARQIVDHPTERGFLDKLAAFVNNLLGTLSERQQVRAIFDAFNDGQFNNPKQVNRMVEQAAGETIGDKVARIAGPLHRAFEVVTAESINRIRGLNLESADLLANSIRQDLASETGGYDDFTIAKNRMSGQMRNMYSDLVKDVPSHVKEEAVRRFMMGLEPSTEFEQNAFTMMRQLTAYNGRPIMGIDTDIIKKRRVEFVEAVQKAARTDTAGAYAAFDYLIANGGFIGQDTDPWLLGYHKRVPKAVKEAFTPERMVDLSEFFELDMDIAVDRAIIQFAHGRSFKAVFPERNGRNGAEHLLFQMGIEGASEKETDDAREWAMQAVGVANQDSLSASTRNASAWAMFAMNTATLPLALVSQLIDPLAIAARSGNFRDAFKAYGTGLKHLFNQMRGAEDRTNGYDMARMLGTIQEEVAANAMGSTSLNMSRTLHKYSSKFFKWNGMQGWNDAMRIAATVAGRDYIKAKFETGDHNALAEMNLVVDQLSFDGDGNLLVPPNSPVARALTAYVESSVARADTAYQPGWMSDPRFALLAHLKRFTYAFSNTVLSRAMYRAEEHGELAPMGFLLASAPVILAADMAKWAALGIDPTQNWGPMAYIQYAAFRSGLAGRTSAFIAPDFAGGLFKLDTPPIIDTLGSAAKLDLDGVMDMTVVGHRFI